MTANDFARKAILENVPESVTANMTDANWAEAIDTFWAESAGDPELVEGIEFELDLLQDALDALMVEGNELDSHLDTFTERGDDAGIERTKFALAVIERDTKLARKSIAALQDALNKIEEPFAANRENCPERFLEW